MMTLLHAAEMPAEVHFQAHRGGLLEVPENTLAAYRHAWGIPGAVPEIDVTVTRDGAMVCIHDDTLARTTTAPDSFKDKPISKITLEELRSVDAGAKFDPKYAREKVPLLTEVFAEMKGRPEREAYLDLKNVDLTALLAQIDAYGLRKQIIFVHGSPATCITLQNLYPGARTMTWISGSPDRIREGFKLFAAAGFKGVSQLQFHLANDPASSEIHYLLDKDFLKEAVEKTRAAGVELQLRPFAFDAKSLHELTELGVRWFVADAPKRFADCLAGN